MAQYLPASSAVALRTSPAQQETDEEYAFRLLDRELEALRAEKAELEATVSRWQLAYSRVEMERGKLEKQLAACWWCSRRRAH